MSIRLIAAFRAVSLVEGLTYLTLIGIAMPLKYVLGRPEAVQFVGWAHGAAFVCFSVCLAAAHLRFRPPVLESAGLFVASLVPFGFLYIDRRLRFLPASTKPASV